MPSNVTHFTHHVVECPNCGHHARGATKLVAQARDREHAAKCDEQIRKNALAAEAKDRQGTLF